MKRLLFFFLLLGALGANAQLYQTINVYGYKYKRAIIDSAFSVPNDTFAIPVGYRHLPHIAAKDTVVYLWSPSLQAWKIGAGSGGTVNAADSSVFATKTWVNNALTNKQNKITLGTTAQYFRGDLSLSNFATDVLNTVSPYYSPIGHSHSGLVPTGGLTGQILKKASGNDYDYYWGNDNEGTSGTSPVTSVFGRTGPVTAQSTDYLNIYLAVGDTSTKVASRHWVGQNYKPLSYVPTFSEIASKPTNLSGYGITDAYTKTEVDNKGYLANITGKVQAGTNVTLSGAGTAASPYVINASGGGTATDTTSLSNRINKKVDSINLTSNTLKYYKNGTATNIAQMAVLNLTSPTNGQIPVYNNGEWVNQTPAAGIYFNEWLFTASNGQTAFINDTLTGKHVRVWRERELQIPGTDVSISGNSIAFSPALASGERIYIEASTTAVWSEISTGGGGQSGTPVSVWPFTTRLTVTGNTLTATSALDPNFAYGASSSYLPDATDGSVEFTVELVTSTDVGYGTGMISLDAGSDAQSPTSQFDNGIYVYDSKVSYVKNGTATVTGITAIDGMRLRLRREGAVMNYEYSTNSGATWVSVTTNTSVTTALYAKAWIYRTGWKVKNIMGVNLQ